MTIQSNLKVLKERSDALGVRFSETMFRSLSSRYDVTFISTIAHAVLNEYVEMEIRNGKSSK